jgi:hypothetical protein
MADGHFGRPGWDLWPLHGRTPGVQHRNYSSMGSLTAFLVPELTREAVLAAMRARRVYATSGVRIALEVDWDGHAMGAEYVIDALPRLRAAVHGSAPLALIEVIRNDRRALRVEVGGALDHVLDWCDPAPSTGTSYYYLRVTQVDDGIAWSSPVWIDYRGPMLPPQDLPRWDDPPHWPPDDPGSVDPRYTARLQAIFAERGLAERFAQVQQRGVFRETRGRYALFRARDAQRSHRVVRIHLYVDFPDDRLYIVDGESDYGQFYRWG